MSHIAQALVMRAVVACAALVLLAAGPAQAQMKGHGGGGMHMHGADGTGHDEVTMPGLRGQDATPEESAEIGQLFRNFMAIDRTVDNLPNGIRTVTTSNDPEVRDQLVSHVLGMLARVEEGRDPQIIIQSPTLSIFFERPEAITTEVEMIETGIVVTQTSEDPEVVKALQLHAAEVTAMADQGMHAVHQMMMERAGN